MDPRRRDDDCHFGVTPMRHIVRALTVLILSTTLTQANPPTAAPHNERHYKAIGGGLYLRADDDLSADDDGNTGVTVFSRNEISAGGNYTFRLTGSEGVRWRILDGTYDAGSLGELHGQLITIDCVHRTYAVTDARKEDPETIWRTASTLPVLAPVFRYVCAAQPRPEAADHPSQSYTRSRCIRDHNGDADFCKQQ